jgi:hypothetical protein
MIDDLRKNRDRQTFSSLKMLHRTYDKVDMRLYFHDRLDYNDKMRQNLMNQLIDQMHNNHSLILNRIQCCEERKNILVRRRILFNINYFGSLVALFRKTFIHLSYIVNPGGSYALGTYIKS